MDFERTAQEVAAILARRGFPREPTNDHGWFWITPERLHIRPKNRVQLVEDRNRDLRLHRAAWTGDGFSEQTQTSILHDISPAGIAELIQLTLRHVQHVGASPAEADR